MLLPKQTKMVKTTKHIMTSSVVLIYYLVFLISIRYFLLRLLAKIFSPTRITKLVSVIWTTKEKDVKFGSNARLFSNLILQLFHGAANICHTK